MNRVMKKLACIACAALLLVAAPRAVAAQEGEDAFPTVTAGSYLVMDAATGQVLVESGMNVRKYPASITKIVTLGLAMQALNAGTVTWDTQLTVSETAVDLIPGASSVDLVAGEVVTFGDMVYATQLRSANDAANVVAEALAGSIVAFAGQMNSVVAGLGLTGTNFTNPHGLPDTQHYTTAYDMAVLTAWAKEIPGFMEVFSALLYDMPATNMWNTVRQLGTSNSILLEESSWHFEGLTGSKSGFTNDAGYTLVTTAERDGMELICVVLQCATNEAKFNSTVALIEYCFDNFVPVQYTVSVPDAVKVPVYGGGTGQLGEVEVQPYSGELSLLLHRSLSRDDIRVEYNIPEQFVIGGGSFAPGIAVTIPNEIGQYSELWGADLEWGGIEDVVAQNTTIRPARAAEPQPFATPAEVLAVGAIVTLVVLLAMLVWRIVYVQQRRRRRYAQRMRMLAAARGGSRYNRPVHPPQMQRVPAGRGGAQPATANAPVQVYRRANSPRSGHR